MFQVMRHLNNEGQVYLMESVTTEGQTLWMLFCDTGTYLEGVPLYAASEEDAQRQADTWIAEQQMTRRIWFYDLRHFPNGFTIVRSTLPGKV